MAAGWAVGVALTYLLLPPDNPDDALRLRGVVLGSLVVVAGGLLDDRYDLPPWAQLSIQLIGALVAIVHIIFIEVFTNPLPSPGLWQALPLFSMDRSLVEIWRPLALLFKMCIRDSPKAALTQSDPADAPGLEAATGKRFRLPNQYHTVFTMQQIRRGDEGQS